MIEKQILKEWLANINQTRDWLAEQCAVSKSTVDGWLSKRSIPKSSAKRIRELMAGTPTPQQVTVSLTREEYALVETATKLGGYATLDTFAHHAVMDAAQNQIQARGEMPPKKIPGYLQEPPPEYPQRSKKGRELKPHSLSAACSKNYRVYPLRRIIRGPWRISPYQAPEADGAETAPPPPEEEPARHSTHER